MLVKDLARELVEVRRRDAPVRGARAPSSRVRSFFSNLNRRLVRRLTIPPSVPSQSDRVKEALENFKDAFARAKKESSADGAEAKEVLAAIDEIARVIPADDVCARFARAIAHGATTIEGEGVVAVEGVVEGDRGVGAHRARGDASRRVAMRRDSLRFHISRV